MALAGFPRSVPLRGELSCLPSGWGGDVQTIYSACPWFRGDRVYQMAARCLFTCFNFPILLAQELPGLGLLPHLGSLRPSGHRGHPSPAAEGRAPPSQASTARSPGPYHAFQAFQPYLPCHSLTSPSPHPPSSPGLSLAHGLCTQPPLALQDPKPTGPPPAHMVTARCSGQKFGVLLASSPHCWSRRKLCPAPLLKILC